MIEKIRELDGHTFYRDTEGNKFSRVLAGIAWPESRPGFIVSVAEDYYASDPQGDVRHLRVLGEAEEMEPERLFQKCIDFRERYQIERFIADTQNESVLNLLQHFNNGLDGADWLTLCYASFDSDLLYHLSIIKSCVQPHNKKLHIGDCRLLRDYLIEINLDDVSKGKANYPAIMALGYVIAYAKNHPRDPIKDRLMQICQEREEEYHPLTFNLWD